eukprot:TRINITY_DN4343_c0_g1_i1.p1 TRINITY_DN4343_c0_g1~~TRINITY_DN4343_c0_g1_i1.p1  ORF type:complete len:204 (-),score=41.89 TRINITY_DN4343_c0_g1_i1:73-663(-)
MLVMVRVCVRVRREAGSARLYTTVRPLCARRGWVNAWAAVRRYSTGEEQPKGASFLSLEEELKFYKSKYTQYQETQQKEKQTINKKKEIKGKIIRLTIGLVIFQVLLIILAYNYLQQYREIPAPYIGQWKSDDGQTLLLSKDSVVLVNPDGSKNPLSFVSTEENNKLNLTVSMKTNIQVHSNQLQFNNKTFQKLTN